MKFKKVVIKAYYDLGEEFISFPDNPLHGKSYENVTVKFKKAIRTICGISFDVDIVEISGQKPIECQLIGRRSIDDTLIIEICQDWG